MGSLLAVGDDADLDMESIGEPSPFVDMVVGPGQPDNSRFGELLGRLRWRAGLSRADAAAKLGLSPEYLRLIEAGKRIPALGQMRKFLAVYGANGAVGEVSPDGYRQDLLVFDPIHGDDGDPTIVEFTSRIREARRIALGGPPDVEHDLRPHQRGGPNLSASRAAEIGQVVSLLTRANDSTLSKIRGILERDVGYDADPGK